MLRVVGGVVAGYLTMAALVSLTFSGLYRLLGAEGTFKPGSYEVTGNWLAGTLVLNVVAALFGGLVSVSVGRRMKSATILSSAVLALGLGAALMSFNRREPLPPRTEVLGGLEAARNAVEPSWIRFSNPIIGAAGVLLGARVKRPS
jgi:hypothetical protein